MSAKSQINISLPDGVLSDARKTALRRNVSLQDVVCSALRTLQPRDVTGKPKTRGRKLKVKFHKPVMFSKDLTCNKVEI